MHWVGASWAKQLGGTDGSPWVFAKKKMVKRRERDNKSKRSEGHCREATARGRFRKTGKGATGSGEGGNDMGGRGGGPRGGCAHPTRTTRKSSGSISDRCRRSFTCGTTDAARADRERGERGGRVLRSVWGVEQLARRGTSTPPTIMHTKRRAGFRCGTGIDGWCALSGSEFP